MDFKFGVLGFSKAELDSVLGLVNMPGPFMEIKSRDNFVEFSAKGFWEGMDVVNRLATLFGLACPSKFSPSRTKIWVNGQTLDVFLVGKVQIAEQAMGEAVKVLRRGRSKKPLTSNQKSRQARLLLEKTLKDFLV